ncbi:MAG: DUF1540 domain-containing protein [Clostridia bacterium]|nr:DUF1540 domain-containing protein [Clostridia bacterium]
MKKNSSVKCDVKKCCHNLQGCDCELKTIKVSCGKGTSCTCCEDYEEK